MKEASGEVSMTVVTIVVLAAFAALMAIVFSTNGTVRQWVEGLFTKQVTDTIKTP